MLTPGNCEQFTTQWPPHFATVTGQYSDLRSSRVQYSRTMDSIFAALVLTKSNSIYKSSIQNCKQLFMYMNNWDEGVAPAICSLIFGTGEYSTIF